MTVHHQTYLITERASIADALAAITENRRGAVIVVGKNRTLVGVVSDGDIRRALVKGGTTLTPLQKIVNMNVMAVKYNQNLKKESKRIFDKYAGINLIPVIDERNRVADVVVRGVTT